jgi:hypothetical protein
MQQRVHAAFATYVLETPATYNNMTSYVTPNKGVSNFKKGDK